MTQASQKYKQLSLEKTWKCQTKEELDFIAMKAEFDRMRQNKPPAKSEGNKAPKERA
jgi:hypothetical protein